MTSPRTRTVTWQDPALLLEGANGKTGLQLLTAIVRGELPQAPIGHTLDFRLVHAEDGLARFEGETGEHQYNPMGTVHGGWTSTLLDSAMGSAVMSTLDEKTAYTTLQLGIHLTKAITKDTGKVIAEGRVLQRGSRVATAEGSLRNAAGDLLAHGTTTCLVFPRPAGKR